MLSLYGINRDYVGLDVRSTCEQPRRRPASAFGIRLLESIISKLTVLLEVTMDPSFLHADSKNSDQTELLILFVTHSHITPYNAFQIEVRG